MRDSLVGGEQGGREDLGRVFAREVAGFGGRVEDLLAGGLVDGQVVYGLVGLGPLGGVGGLGEHGEDGALVGFC